MIQISDKLKLLGSTFVSQGLRVLTTFVLARLLTPKDYGLVALLLAIPGLIGLGDFGVARSMVQIRGFAEDAVIHTGLVLSVSVGVFWAVVHIACGGYLATVYDDRNLFYLSLINALGAILLAVYTFQLSCLSRKLEFGRESNQNIVLAVALALAGIALAFAGFGVYALVVQPVVAIIVANLMIYRTQPLFYPSKFDPETARQFWRFGWKVTASGYATNAQTSLLNLVVAYFAGVVGLGIFGRAVQVRELVGSNVLGSFDRLLFPALADAQKDEERSKRIFLRGCAGITLLSALGGVLIFATSDDLVRVMLGAQWGAVPPLLSILSLGLIVGGLALPSTALSLALGQPFVTLRFAFANLLMTVPLALLVGNMGLTAVCALLAVSQSIIAAGLWLWALRALHIPFKHAALYLLPIILSALVCLAAMVGVRHYLPIDLPALARLLTVGFIGVCIYAGLIWSFDRNTVREIGNLIKLPVPETAPAAG